MNLVTFEVKNRARVMPRQPGQPDLARNISAMLLGRRLLNKMLGDRQLSVTDIPREILLRLLAGNGVISLAGLYEDIGTGKLPASAVLRSLLELNAQR